MLFRATGTANIFYLEIGLAVFGEGFRISNYKMMAKSKKPKHIAVAGNIGAGKTTLTEMLSKHYRWIPQFEDVDHNPYLNDFYEDMPRWSFNLQVFFLNTRLNQLLEIYSGTETVVQDRTIYEDAHIFAPNLHDMGLMSKRDYNNYFQFFQTLKRMVQPPDLLIYLQASVPTLVGQIQKRGREYEENIRLDYLKRLNELYNKWIDNYKEGPLLVIDIDKNKFPENEEHLGEIIIKIDAQLYGLF
ncbi:MAG TPA: deoxynucleoside kinase [Puia sp.]|jgi:deoxyadenosine/deoxycytidine kinase|nr:deoxynucleoside kinase [Puia sp.]